MAGQNGFVGRGYLLARFECRKDERPSGFFASDQLDNDVHLGGIDHLPPLFRKKRPDPTDGRKVLFSPTRHHRQLKLGPGFGFQQGHVFLEKANHPVAHHTAAHQPDLNDPVFHFEFRRTVFSDLSLRRNFRMRRTAS